MKKLIRSKVRLRRRQLRDASTFTPVGFPTGVLVA